MVHGFWFLVSGFWFLVSGFWFLVSGFWLVGYGKLKNSIGANKKWNRQWHLGECMPHRPG
jgi:hypothetical protein